MEKVHFTTYFSYVSFEVMTTFEHAISAFCLYLCFRLSVPSRLHALGSVCPFILTLAFSRFCVLNLRQVLCGFSLPVSLSLPPPSPLTGWVDVRTTVPQGVEWKTEFVHLECKEERKWERVMDGWMDGWMKGGVWGCI